jgi:CubicO group peptidase (beta-lactamase class C family)
VTEEALEERVRGFLQNEMMMDHIPGISVVVVNKGKVLLTRGYGYADPETKTPATPATVYEIGSMTKQFTAAAVMILAEQGKISLDDAIAKYLGTLPPDWNKITVRHLLTHTSGIAEFTALPELKDRFKQGEMGGRVRQRTTAEKGNCGSDVDAAQAQRRAARHLWIWLDR